MTENPYCFITFLSGNKIKLQGITGEIVKITDNAS